MRFVFNDTPCYTLDDFRQALRALYGVPTNMESIVDSARITNQGLENIFNDNELRKDFLSFVEEDASVDSGQGLANQLENIRNEKPAVNAWFGPILGVAPQCQSLLATMDAQWEEDHKEKSYGMSGLYIVLDLIDRHHVSITELSGHQGKWTDEYKTTKLVLRRIEPGSFIIDSPSREVGGNGIPHMVTLTHPFYIGVFPVTQRQWGLIMGKNPSFVDEVTAPVKDVSYEDIRGSRAGRQWPGSSVVDEESFLGKLRKSTSWVGFDLPTEAQWEYACRAGTQTPFSFGKVLNGRQANCDGRHPYGTRATGPFLERTCAVGSYAPNPWGLYDMHGNVWEWCRDWSGYDYGDETDPRGPDSGVYRVIRGGCWFSEAEECSCDCSHALVSDARHSGLGFRLVCSVNSSKDEK